MTWKRYIAIVKLKPNSEALQLLGRVNANPIGHADRQRIFLPGTLCCERIEVTPVFDMQAPNICELGLLATLTLIESHGPTWNHIWQPLRGYVEVRPLPYSFADFLNLAGVSCVGTELHKSDAGDDPLIVHPRA